MLTEITATDKEQIKNKDFKHPKIKLVRILDSDKTIEKDPITTNNLYPFIDGKLYAICDLKLESKAPDKVRVTLTFNCSKFESIEITKEELEK